jgi:hypothetical protein
MSCLPAAALSSIWYRTGPSAERIAVTSSVKIAFPPSVPVPSAFTPSTILP